MIIKENIIHSINTDINQDKEIRNGYELSKKRQDEE